ncbi:class I SAM-dependent methyltransferase [soil metagenome]
MRELAAVGYGFTTPVPTTYRRLALLRRREHAEARNLVDIFGWNLPFRPELIAPRVLELMREGAFLHPLPARGSFRSGLRVGSVGDALYLHSPFPAPDAHAVFFGPDSYRFVEFIRAEMERAPSPGAILDIGTGSGVGGLFAWSRARAAHLTLSDINPLALQLAKVNAAFQGASPDLVLCSGVPAAGEGFDLIVADPPYVGGRSEPVYSRGGGERGEALALRWLEEALPRLRPGGRMLLYTGVAIVGGRDLVKAAFEAICATAGCASSYCELDPDIFPSLLLKPDYWGVDRVAAVGAVAVAPGAPKEP